MQQFVTFYLFLTHTHTHTQFQTLSPPDALRELYVLEEECVFVQGVVQYNFFYFLFHKPQLVSLTEIRDRHDSHYRPPWKMS